MKIKEKNESRTHRKIVENALSFLYGTKIAPFR
jgi:hypothetical protein